MNQRIEDLIAKFRPQFGNAMHIALAERIGKYRRLQKSVAAHAARVRSLDKAVRRNTENEKRLTSEEMSLIAQLEKEINGSL